VRILSYPCTNFLHLDDCLRRVADHVGSWSTILLVVILRTSPLAFRTITSWIATRLLLCLMYQKPTHATALLVTLRMVCEAEGMWCERMEQWKQPNQGVELQ
jgi:hypothetical protein